MSLPERWVRYVDGRLVVSYRGGGSRQLSLLERIRWRLLRRPPRR